MNFTDFSFTTETLPNFTCKKWIMGLKTEYLRLYIERTIIVAELSTTRTSFCVFEDWKGRSSWAVGRYGS